jgi:hypothetical protein
VEFRTHHRFRKHRIRHLPCIVHRCSSTFQSELVHPDIPVVFSEILTTISGSGRRATCVGYGTCGTFHVPCVIDYRVFRYSQWFYRLMQSYSAAQRLYEENKTQPCGALLRVAFKQGKPPPRGARRGTGGRCAARTSGMSILSSRLAYC